MKKTLNTTAIIILAGVLVIALIGSIVLGAVTLDRVSAMADIISKSVTEDVAQENDVTIASEYEIKSTEHISDAYKNGSTNGLSDRDKETLDMASKILDEIITENMTAYEKEQAVYDWMTHELRFEAGSLLVVPETGEDSDNPYGVLKFHSAVCVGYATTFRLFMQMLDIPCMVVHNSELYHSWDLVQLDGEWYHTDIYSDSDTGNYSHFNLSDSQMSAQGQTWNRDFFPAATGFKYSYAYQHCSECGDLYDLPALVREMMDNQESCAAFSFTKEITEEDAQIVQVMMENVQNAASYSADFCNLYMSWSWLSTPDKGYLLSINIEGYDYSCDEPQVTIPDDAYTKVDEAVSVAFGDVADNGGDNYGDDYEGIVDWTEEAVG